MFKKLPLAIMTLLIFAFSAVQSQTECEDNLVAIITTTQIFGNEVSWDLLDESGNILAQSEESMDSNSSYADVACLTDGCYIFQMYDSFGDGWNGTEVSFFLDGELLQSSTFISGSSSTDLLSVNGDADCVSSYGCTDESACNYDADATSSDGSCTYPGCMDETATNYNPWAGCEDNSLCIYPIECEDGQTLAQLYVCVFSFGENVELSIADEDGNVVWEQYGFSDGLIFYFDLCLEEGTCYTATMSNPEDTGWYNGYFWVNVGNDMFGSTQVIQESLDADLSVETVDFSIDGTCGPAYGCTDEEACNYDADADTEDWSCTYPGCQDESANNYNPWAGCEDNSLCTYPIECEDGQILSTLYVCTFGSGQNVELSITDDDGNVVWEQYGFNNVEIMYEDLCLEEGVCYTATMTNPEETGWYGGYFWLNVDGVQITTNFLDADLSFETTIFSLDGTCGPAFGCTDPTACNYDADATDTDGSCTYPGCMDPIAINYNPFAGCADDSLCEYTEDCESNIVNTLMETGPWSEEISWTLVSESGDIVAEESGYSDTGAYTSYACLEDGCYTLILNDSFGDGWNGAVLTFSLDGIVLYSGTLDSGDLGYATFGVNTSDCEETEISGCTDPLANNYDPNATVDDGSCEYGPNACQALFGVFDIDTDDAIVVVINLSTGEDLSYFWDFGDGNTSTDPYPIHVYEEVGTYEVCLTVTGGNPFFPCEDTYCAEITYDGLFLMIDGEIIGDANSTEEGGFTINVYPDEDSIPDSVYENDLDQNDISLYPNPVADLLNVQFENISSTLSYEIYDISGRMISSVQNLKAISRTDIDVSSFGNGMYLVKFETPEGTVAKRFEVAR